MKGTYLHHLVLQHRQLCVVSCHKVIFRFGKDFWLADAGGGRTHRRSQENSELHHNAYCNTDKSFRMNHLFLWTDTTSSSNSDDTLEWNPRVELVLQKKGICQSWKPWRNVPAWIQSEWKWSQVGFFSAGVGVDRKRRQKSANTEGGVIPGRDSAGRAKRLASTQNRRTSAV